MLDDGTVGRYATVSYNSTGVSADYDGYFVLDGNNIPANQELLISRVGCQQKVIRANQLDTIGNNIPDITLQCGTDISETRIATCGRFNLRLGDKCLALWWLLALFILLWLVIKNKMK